MAVLSCYPGLWLRANVRVGGEVAEEYDAPPEEVQARSKTFEYHKLRSGVGERTPYSLCYIEAKPGEPFEFVIDIKEMMFHRSEKPQQIVLTAVLDGFEMHPELVTGELYTLSECLTGSPKTGFSKMKFHFAALDILEGPVPEKDIKKQIEEANNYGALLIKLQLVHMKSGCLHSLPANFDLTIPKPPVLEVAEKDLKGKAVDSRTRFQSEPTYVPSFTDVQAADYKGRPFAIFEFRYRTMEGLMREYIVPRPREVINVEEENMRIKRVKPESAVEPRGIKREPVDAALFAARYKQRRTKSESKSVAPTIPSFAEHIQHGHAKPPPLSASSSGRSQPAAHTPQVPSSTPVLQKPSEGIFDMFRPNEQSKIFSHHIASENRSSPSLNSSSALKSGLLGGSGDQSTRSSRSFFTHSFPETKSPFPSKPALWPTNPSTAPSLVEPRTAPNLFGAPPAPYPRPFAQLPPPDAPGLAAAVKPAPEMIVSAWPSFYSQSASPFSTVALGRTREGCDGSSVEDPVCERPGRSPGKIEDSQDEYSEDGESYELEVILDHKLRSDGSYKYRIKWLGYGHEYNRWKTEKELREAKELIKEYWERKGGRDKEGRDKGSRAKEGRKGARRTTRVTRSRTKK